MLHRPQPPVGKSCQAVACRRPTGGGCRRHIFRDPFPAALAVGALPLQVTWLSAGTIRILPCRPQALSSTTPTWQR